VTASEVASDRHIPGDATVDLRYRTILSVRDGIERVQETTSGDADRLSKSANNEPGSAKPSACGTIAFRSRAVARAVSITTALTE